MKPLIPFFAWINRRVINLLCIVSCSRPQWL